MTEYIKNPLSGKLRGVTYEDGKIIDVHIRDTDDVVKVFTPVQHGRWEVGYFHDRVCSCCLHPDNDFDDYAHKFCPHCGAKMDGGEC